MKVEFLSPLHTLKTLGLREWTLMSSFGVRIDKRELTIPKGFVTDLASVPRLPVVYLLAGDSAHEAAVIHDWLYRMQEPRAFADRVFLAAMEAMGEPWWRRWLMYAGVRLGGWVPYARRGNEVVELDPVPAPEDDKFWWY